MNKTVRLRGVLVASLLLLGPGCTREPQHGLRIGSNVWPGHEPFYLAREKGYVNDHSVRLVEYTSASEVMRAFRNGAIQGAALTFDEAIQLAATGSDLKAVVVMDISHGADVILATPGINSLPDLKGRRIGVETAALGADILSRALESVGLQGSDVVILPLEVSEHERAWKEGRIDAVVTFEPVRTTLLAAGGLRLFDSSQIPGEIIDVLVIRRDFVRAHPDQVRQVLVGWFQAITWLGRNPSEATEVMAPREKVSASELERALEGLRFPDVGENRRLLDGESPRLLHLGRRLMDVMLDKGLIPREIARTHEVSPPYIVELARKHALTAAQLIGDIVLRKRAEEELYKLNANLEQRVRERTQALAESEKRFRTIYDTAPVSIWQEDWTEVIEAIDGLRCQGVTEQRTGPGTICWRAACRCATSRDRSSAGPGSTSISAG